ncbi:PPE family protein [[Mycobacterium] nativiensis]|uniref:PPE family protein n=1 Tax=[Mycobacterium] nativiensis TaxID=2855503 RepID=A0ABU5XZ72_9MYCO|nr:PPE family protein [Mycolicibacter sp. MYC340]MEB3032306.1 PPE family protein [Mycolicibacter sp. MYC340]
MDFALLPPEVNSGRMYSGPGAAPMLTAAAAWDALAAELEVAAVGYSEVVTSLTGHAWSGSSSAAMATAAAPYVAWLQAGATKAEQTAMQARTVAAAYETAFAATVPPAEVTANRALLATLVATNFFGQNTPAIAATEIHYAEMWAQDAVAMYGYAVSAASASALPPLDQPPQTTDPTGPGGQSGAVSHAAGSNGLNSAVQSALQQLSAPADASTPPPNGFETISDALNPLTPFTSLASSGLSFDSAMYTVVSNGAGWGRLLFVRGGMEGALTFEGLGPRGVLSASTTPAPSLGMGRATPIGGLSVPPSWASAAPELRPTAFTLAAAETRLPVPVGGMMPPGTVFQEAMMGTTAGQGATADTTNGRRTKKTGDKNEDQDGKPITNGSGWLGASMAYHNRPRESQPLPTHWRTG